MKRKLRLRNSFWLIALFLGVVDLLLQNYFRSRGVGMANDGISFGAIQGIRKEWVLVVWMVFAGWFLYEKKTGKTDKNFYWFILVGGLVNVASRFVWGHVWDYLYFWPLPFWFNLSDVLINMGVIFYIIGL